MKNQRIRRPSPALVIAVIALICALTGTAWAALGKNSVGSKQLKKNSVTTAKIKKEAVAAGKIKKATITGKQINLAKLGTVPSAEVANSIPPSPVHVVGAAGEPGFQGGAHNLGSAPGFPVGVGLPGASFIKTRDNIVQLEGVVEIPTGAPLPVAYQLPPGFRPPAGQLVIMEQNETTLIVAGSNVVLEGHDISGDVLTVAEKPAILSGFSFFAGS
jgi:hypothetical protein